MNSKNRVLWGVIIVVVLVIIVYAVSNNGSSQSGIIKVGFLGPLSGDAAAIGQEDLAGAKVAVDEVNTAGGISGKKIQLIAEDGQCNAAVAVNAAQKLINVDGVRFIIGGGCSTESAAMGPIAMQAKVIMISPVSSAPSLSKLGKYFFRTYPSDAFAGKFDAEYAYNKLGARKVAIMYHVSDYGTGMKDVFLQRFQELGGTIVDVEGTPQTATDYRTALSKIKSAHPDLIFAPMYPAGSIPMVNQAAQLGITQTFIDGDAWGDANFQKAASGKGTFIFSTAAISNIPQDLQAKIEAAAGGAKITDGTPNAYDGVKVLAAAIAKAGTEPDQLADAIRATQYNGISGHISFDQNGDLTSAAYTMNRMENGSYVQISK